MSVGAEWTRNLGPLAIMDGFDGPLLQVPQSINAENISRVRGVLESKPPTFVNVGGGVAEIQIRGPLVARPSWWEAWLGIRRATIGEIEGAVRRYATDPDIHTLLLSIESPGGVVSGIHELADAIHEARGNKRVVAYTAELCGSAAYWIASQAEEFWAGPASIVGSIGTYTLLIDASRAYEDIGYKVFRVRSTELKGGGAWGTKIEQSTIDETQRLVNSLNALFVGGVARGRGVDMETAEAWADARVHVGQAAVEIGLVDQVISRNDVPTQLRDTSTNATSSARLPLAVGDTTVLVDAQPLGTPQGAATHWARHPETGDPVLFAVGPVDSSASTPAAPAAQDADVDLESLSDEELKAQVGEQVDAYLLRTAGIFPS
ncbi:MAG: S49 family peptidase [Acidobacteriota bacterium]